MRAAMMQESKDKNQTHFLKTAISPDLPDILAQTAAVLGKIGCTQLEIRLACLSLCGVSTQPVKIKVTGEIG